MSVRVRVKTPDGKTEIWNLNMSESTLKWYLRKKEKEGYGVIQVLSGAKPKSYKVEISKENLEKVKRTYLENIKKSVYNPKNIEKLRAFGWSDEKIREWQQEQLKKAEERVKNPAELQKLAKYFVEKGKIPGEVVITDLEVKDSEKNRIIKRVNQNLKKPIPEPKPEPKSTTMATPKPQIDLSKIESKKEYRVTYKHKNGNTYTANLLGTSIKLLVQNGSIVDILKIEEMPKTSKPTLKPIPKPVPKPVTPKPVTKPTTTPKPTTKKKFDLKKLALGVLGLIIAFKLLKR